MIRILHTSDFHLGIPLSSFRGRDLKTRVNDLILNSIDESVRYAIENDIDLYIVAGDIFNGIQHSLKYGVRLATRLRSLLESNVGVIMVAGNHDKPKERGSHNALELLDIIRVDGLHYIQGLLRNKPLRIRVDGMDIGIVTLPYIDLRGLDPDREVSSYIREQLSRLDKIDYRILIAHYDLKGAKYYEYMVDPLIKSYIDIGFKVSPPALHPESFNYIALGHIHLYQNIKGYSNIWYSGSINRVNFGESRQDKGFIVAEITEDRLRIEFIKVKPIKMINIRGIELDEGRPLNNLKSILDSYRDLDGGLLKLNIILKGNEDREIRSRISELDEYLLEERGVLGYLIEYSRRRGIEPIKIDYSGERIEEALVKYINESREINGDIKARIKEKALDTINRAMHHEEV